MKRHQDLIQLHLLVCLDSYFRQGPDRAAAKCHGRPGPLLASCRVGSGGGSRAWLHRAHRPEVSRLSP
jgi:hypothetical protein